MKAIYSLNLRPEVLVPVQVQTDSLIVDGAVCSWSVDEAGNLASVEVEFQGLPITYTDDGRIMPTTPSLQEQAYRVANFLANQIYFQTAIDAIDPNQIVLGSPAVFPESLEEQATFARTPRRVWKTISGGWSIQAKFDPAWYACRYADSIAYGYFSDAMRATGVFQKYELLFKVIEYFFPQSGSGLDAAVSAHAAAHDSIFV
ncbi:hypothetical protein, partial [Hydrogenophaga sp.]|uniref:hypothetical protein n=1 Tax=Hydrogenophaga sp. TaxID=1904254 RepID=UPI00356514A6